MICDRIWQFDMKGVDSGVVDCFCKPRVKIMNVKFIGKIILEQKIGAQADSSTLWCLQKKIKLQKNGILTLQELFRTAKTPF